MEEIDQCDNETKTEKAYRLTGNGVRWGRQPEKENRAKESLFRAERRAGAKTAEQRQRLGKRESRENEKEESGSRGGWVETAGR